MPTIPPPRESGFSTSTAVPLYWARYGPPSGAPLLILHGGPGAEHDYMLPQMLALTADRCELIFYDQRGGGRSRTEDRSPITWRTQVDDLALMIAELGVQPLTLVGYSWGALLAILYMVEASAGRSRPVPIKAVLIDPAPITRSLRDRFEAEFARRQAGPEVRSMRAELARSGLRGSDPEAYRHRAFELSVAGYFADPRKATQLTPFRVVGRVQESIWESLGDFDLITSGDLDAIRIRTLIIHGRQDPIPLESSTALAAAVRGQLVILEECGHVPYVEQPEKLFAAIDAFLTDL